jgi:hypothetical protein
MPRILRGWYRTINELERDHSFRKRYQIVTKPIVLTA